MRALAYAAVLSAASLIASPSLNAETASPIFGSAAVQPTSKAQNKEVIGKGYYADYYGYYGTLFAYYGYVYGASGYNYKSADYYYYAYLYSGYAANYFLYANYYQTYNY